MKKVLMTLVAMILLASCQPSSEEEYRITNINIYQNTEAWELAQAVKNQDVKKIDKIATESPDLLNYQDSKYQTTLLVWAVGTERYKSAEALLKNGADPNIISSYVGGTALYEAAGFSWVDNNAKKDAMFVKLLLEYGADPNINYVGTERNNSTEIGTSPLMRSINCGLEKTKALVDAGADVDYKLPSGVTAAIGALSWGAGNVTLEAREYAYYLIVEKQANITDAYDIVLTNNEPASDPKFQPVDLLRRWICKPDSEDYNLKMEIIDEFTRQGVDYWSTPIPQSVLEQIQKLYPDIWEEYIKKY